MIIHLKKLYVRIFNPFRNIYENQENVLYAAKDLKTLTSL